MNPKSITPAEIAAAMKMTEGQLWSFSRKFEKMFKPTRHIMIGSKSRPIDVPQGSAKKKLKLLHKWFFDKRLFHSSAHGGVKHRSCFTSAQQHLGKKYVWTRDASNCYPTITPEMYFDELKRIGFRHETAILLTRLCTVRGCIPQGSPVSNDAINLYFWRIDQFLKSFCGMNHLKYSRVADDFVLSGHQKNIGDNITFRLEGGLQQIGIKINDKKRRRSGFQDRSNPQLVHNIRVDLRRGTKISKEHRTKIIDLADSYETACKRVQPSSLEAVACKRKQLMGFLHYARQADLAPIKHLKTKIHNGDLRVSRKLKNLHITAYKGKWWLDSSKRNEPRRLKAIWIKRLESS